MYFGVDAQGLLVKTVSKLRFQTLAQSSWDACVFCCDRNNHSRQDDAVICLGEG